MRNYSLTKIVATLGPATDNEETIKELIEAGMNVARINCSHGNWEARKQRIAMIRKISKELGRSVGILVDLQGPKIRTGTIPNDGVEVAEGEKVILTTKEEDANYSEGIKKVFIRNYPELPSEVSIDQRILLDDGMIRMKVTNISGSEVEAEVTFGGLLKSNKGVNLPESQQLKVEAITKKDREDIIEAVKCRADFIALSFVRRPENIVELNQLIDGCEPEIPIKVIAKIEKPRALDCLEEILKVSDGVMVARGDLGVELEPEKVPLVQKSIIAKANQHNKIVITATQMMDSMVNNPFPTRAEISDVANAILDGTDAVMLSAETASGKYPVETINYMRKIALEVEENTHIKREKILVNEAYQDRIAIAHAVNTLADLDHIQNIAALSCSGASVQLISKFRPKARIIAATTYQHTYNYLSLVWGITPMYFDQVEHTTNTLMNLEDQLIDQKFVEEGESIIVTGGLPIQARSAANFVKLHRCDGSIKDQAEISSKDIIKDLGPMIEV